jgi:hypothetical protein
LFELPHFIMERKMMLTIKARAEGQAKVARERAAQSRAAEIRIPRENLTRIGGGTA